MATLTLNLIQHHSTVLNGMLVERSTNLFLSDVGSSHFDDSLPSMFSKTIGRLTIGGSCNDSDLTGKNPFESLVAIYLHGKEADSMESFGQVTIITTEESEENNNLSGGK